MCIAIAKKMGVNLPTEEIFRNCWESNSDGAGFAFAYQGVVYIKKGFMTFDSFLSALHDCEKRYGLKDCGMLFHFRIATHGGVCPAMTHPFPIVADNGALSKLEYSSDYAVVHNGIISLTSAKATAEKTVSDTAVFIRDYLTLIAENRQWFRREANIELIEKLIDSKMAILNRFGEIINTSGFTEDKGVLYSNTTYKIARVRYNTKNNYTTYYGGSYGSYYDNYPTNYAYDYDEDGYYGKRCKGYKNYNKNSAKSIPLMRCCVGDTISGDSIEDRCISEDNRLYAISKEGYLYYLIYEGKDSDKNSYDCSLEFCGMAQFFDQSTKEKTFTANFWPSENQFVGDSTPENMESSLDDEIVDKTTPDKKKEDTEKDGTKDTGKTEATPSNNEDEKCLNLSDRE